MPKFKPHKGLSKRVKVTARGKVKRKSTFNGHLMSKKSGKRCRQLRRSRLIEGQLGENCKVALGA